MAQTKYFISWWLGIVVLTDLFTGAHYSWMPLVMVMVVLPILEWLLPKNESKPESQDDFIPTLVLLGHALMQSAIMVLFIRQVYFFPDQNWYWTMAAVGVHSGVSGIIIAHELIHRKEKAWRYLGIWNLLTVCYPHFYIEHVRGHHRWVGTDRDPATAKRGESVYAFFLRTIPQQWWSAYCIERDLKQGVLWKNGVVRLWILQLLLIAGLWIVFEPIVVVAFILQSIIAILLLEQINYVEHYGLRRKEGQRVMPHHSWQANDVVSRITLIELSRHSDHHFLASKPFHTLESKEGSAAYPSGYFGMFWLVMIPPLWFRSIHPILDQMEMEFA